jgi:hypothetical protein
MPTAVTKAQVLAEISRTAKENGGVPLGVTRFYTETGIKETDWLGKHWARWGDALKEAGLPPNTLQAAYEEEFLLDKLALLTKELGHFPARTEIQLKGREDHEFPSVTTFRRWGSKSELTAKLARFCEGREGYEDVRQLCAPHVRNIEANVERVTADAEDAFGHVYLLKSGKFYKIGRSNAVGRRERELAIQLPEKASVVHSIRTDDPPGIESYWHRRFESRRKNGEWFELETHDVSAFKRRKFM